MTDDYATTFDDAAVLFGRLGPVLWDPLALRLVELAAPLPGERVLDVCCGTGASAIPVAQAVGPAGAVDAIDVAPGMLEVARAAIGNSVPWLRFQQADATAWDGGPYDLLVSGYGVFFLPDMDASCRRLAGLLRPGGRFAVSTWRVGAFAAFRGCLDAAIEDVTGQAPERRDSRALWARLGTADALTAWVGSLGLVDAHATEVEHTVPLDDDTAWNLVLGMTTRALVDGLPAADLERVRVRHRERLAAEGITLLDARSVVAVGARPR